MKKKNIIFIIAIIIFIIILILLLTNQTKGDFIKLNYNQIKEKISKKEDFVLVVSRTTCSHCLDYKPKVKEITKSKNIIIYYIDYDEESKKNQEKLLDELNLDGSTPITMFFKNGEETSLMDRLNGDLSSSKVQEKLKKMGFIKK